MAGDAALEVHAFCNTAFLARDAGRPREAVRAAQAARSAAAGLGSPRLQALLALREAGGWALPGTAAPRARRWARPAQRSSRARWRPIPSGCPSSTRRRWPG
jgi:hypothetical protein